MTNTHAWSRVRGLEPVSLCDWPGNVVCVLFLGGCNCKCPHCHNADLAWRPSTLPITPRETVEHYIRARGAWLDGLVVTGGEPVMDSSIVDFIDDIGGLGLPIKLDSNGMHPEILETILSLGCVKKVSVDIKGPFEKYEELTGGSFGEEAAREHFAALFEMARRRPEAFHFRTTLVPELTDDDIRTVRTLLPSGCVLTTQQYIEPKGKETTACQSSS
ncbi:anaerobic ribonucleoside-triphosphate reductase activating protein [Desulfovibrio inopinatus]|uniref:anaerobic ribonucleoside-triphosphate reductase activating protein n=1 Tax=Desulfovibrio inopinatus TaxID=102109 RepID=UPI0004877324|nr:anaerobic ribonucleoside-triphosphate reductase activating protein [Desulfovibrio inopinatus]